MDYIVAQKVVIQEEIKSHEQRISDMRSYLSMEDEIVNAVEKQSIRDAISELVELINDKNIELIKIDSDFINFRNKHGIPG